MTIPDPTGPASPAAARNRWADLGPRVISAIVLIAVVAGTLQFGGYIFAVLVAIVVGLTYREWEQMVTLKPLSWFGGVLIALLIVGAVSFPVYGWAGTAVATVVAAVLALFGGREAAAWRVGGLLFFGLVTAGALLMRGSDVTGLLAGWFVGLVVAMTDTGAYFTGRVIGGEKLAPAISPGKTRSGAIGGWVVGTLAGTIFWIVFVPSPWWIGLLLAAVMSIVGQIGDLTESAIKRVFRVKDSGDIVPGHGGLMDRLDSVTFGILFLCVVGALHGGGIGNVPQGFLHW